jgi:hypothetical protein
MLRRSALAVAFVALVAAGAGAGEIGHYAGGLMNIRDLAVPEPGLYGARSTTTATSPAS